MTFPQKQKEKVTRVHNTSNLCATLLSVTKGPHSHTNYAETGVPDMQFTLFQKGSAMLGMLGSTIPVHLPELKKI